MTRLLVPGIAALLISTAAVANEAVPGGHFIENWDLDGDGTVTLAEATEKRGEVFYMFDQDENGVMDTVEYDLFDETRAADRAANADGHTNPIMDNAEGGMRRDFTDADGDGQVSAAEFTGTTAAWFEKVDRNGDGVITTADFGPGKGGMGKGHAMGQGGGMGQAKGN